MRKAVNFTLLCVGDTSYNATPDPGRVLTPTMETRNGSLSCRVQTLSPGLYIMVRLLRYLGFLTGHQIKDQVADQV